MGATQVMLPKRPLWRFARFVDHDLARVGECSISSNIMGIYEQPVQIVESNRVQTIAV